MGADWTNCSMVVLLLTGLAMISTFLGGFVAVRSHRRIHLLLGLGAGMLLGATFFDLLPEAVDVGQTHGWSVRVIFLFLVLGFLGFYILERMLILHACPEGDCANEAHRRLGRLSVMGLIAHSTLDGAAIGAATLVSWRVGVIVALAVIAHDMSDGLNTILLVTRGEAPRRSDYLFLSLDAIAPMVGGVLALGFSPSPKWLAVFLAVASGFFLYTATSDLLPEAHRRSPSPYVMILTIVGVAVMAIAVGLTRLNPESLRRFLHSIT